MGSKAETLCNSPVDRRHPMFKLNLPQQFPVRVAEEEGQMLEHEEENNMLQDEEEDQKIVSFTLQRETVDAEVQTSLLIEAVAPADLAQPVPRVSAPPKHEEFKEVKTESIYDEFAEIENEDVANNTSLECSRPLRIEAIPEEEEDEYYNPRINLTNYGTPQSTPGGVNVRGTDFFQGKRFERHARSEKGFAMSRSMQREENKEREFFKMTLLALKVAHKRFTWVCDVDSGKLYEEAIEAGVQFFDF